MMLYQNVPSTSDRQGNPHRRRQPRRAATAVECAVVYPIVFFLILALVIGAMGVFRYQEVASLARETSRYASCHGGLYAKENNTNVSSSDIYNNVIVPRTVSLDLTQLSYSITCNRPTAVSWDTYNFPYHTIINGNGDILPVQNTVSVTITYHWIPELYLGGVTLSSTSVMPMNY
jgi:Flp pilus assembly protein TadG